MQSSDELDDGATDDRIITDNVHCKSATAIGGERTVYSVDGIPGLQLRVSPADKQGNVAKVWTLRYRRPADNALKRFTIGPFPEVGLAAARQKAKELRDGVRKLVDPAAAKDELREAETFQQVAERWLKSRARKGRAESYVHDNRRRIARLPKSLLETKARSISKGNITRVLDGIADRGKGAETNATHRMLSAILRWATSEGAISSSPAAGVEKRFEDEENGRYFTDTETLLFWKGVGTMDRAEPGTKLAIKLCLVTAQRPIAIANLERRNVVLDGPWPSMTIVKDKIKGRVHVVPLPPLAVSLFRDAIALAGKSAYVFPSPVGHDQPIDEHSLTRAITRNKADDGSLFGIPVTDDGAPKLYTCKKTVSTWLGGGDSPEAEGYLDEEIGLLLGHARTTVTARYNKGKYLAKKREMLEAWCRHLDDLINERGAANVVPFRAAAQGE